MSLTLGDELKEKRGDERGDEPNELKDEQKILSQVNELKIEKFQTL